MISYELAKELKEAGFESKSGYFRCKYPESTDDVKPGDIIETAPVPLLSELIEACGEDFGALYSGGDGTWLAETHYYDDIDGSIKAEANDKHEAVAKLYIALNTVYSKDDREPTNG